MEYLKFICSGYYWLGVAFTLYITYESEKKFEFLMDKSVYGDFQIFLSSLVTSLFWPFIFVIEGFYFIKKTVFVYILSFIKYILKKLIFLDLLLSSS